MSWENMVLNQNNVVESPSLNCLANPLYCPLADHSVSNKTTIKCKVRPEWSRVYKHTGNENCKPVETGVKSGKRGEKSRSVMSKEKYKAGGFAATVAWVETGERRTSFCASTRWWFWWLGLPGPSELTAVLSTFSAHHCHFQSQVPAQGHAGRWEAVLEVNTNSVLSCRLRSSFPSKDETLLPVFFLLIF